MQKTSIMISVLLLTVSLVGCNASHPFRSRPIAPRHYVQIPKDVGSCRYDNSCHQRSGAVPSNSKSAGKSAGKRPASVGKSSGTGVFDADKAIDKLKNL
ncbi:MAG TPA: hypothetical protein PLE99_01450 [Candidatus Thiothrix moscowensis]|mgnify:CR=1 FL=1|uniref:hypothetical protein n=1 Tax=unclassified Thiothrix TaxID=2636184 RepID=UPI0025EE58E2|nr:MULTISPECIES: hypothetical protein [unclassified Thiothrix]HRJ51402.1 hypothetical protein [Candidatus Thiothrix moscowensis]HRJ91543.1 hypothetical protein [Candidatus Thiothrix moscowensis]